MYMYNAISSSEAVVAIRFILTSTYTEVNFAKTVALI